MGRYKMKSLQESLLDDEDTLLDDTDFRKKFPKYGNIKHTTSWEGNKLYYYRWSCPQLLPKYTDGNETLYISFEQFGEYEGEWDINITSSPANKNFYNSQSLIYSSIRLISETSLDALDIKTVRKEVYELFFNISLNLDILNYMRSYDIIKNFHEKQKTIYIDDVKKKFKDTWQNVK